MSLGKMEILAGNFFPPAGRMLEGKPEALSQRKKSDFLTEPWKETRGGRFAIGRFCRTPSTGFFRAKAASADPHS
jgi:hypothetical protein